MCSLRHWNVYIVTDFREHELKVQGSYSDHSMTFVRSPFTLRLSAVRPSFLVRRPYTFLIFDFSETAEVILTKLAIDRKQVTKVLLQVCFRQKDIFFGKENNKNVYLSSVAIYEGCP